MSIGVLAIIGAALLGLALLYAMIRNGQRTAREVEISETAARDMRRNPENDDGPAKQPLQRGPDEP